MFAIALWVALCKEMFQPQDWRCFGDASITVFHSGEVISRENPASFAIHAFVIFSTVQVFQGGTHEAEIN